jgi:hypothetical protein
MEVPLNHPFPYKESILGYPHLWKPPYNSETPAKLAGLVSQVAKAAAAAGSETPGPSLEMPKVTAGATGGQSLAVLSIQWIGFKGTGTQMLEGKNHDFMGKSMVSCRCSLRFSPLSIDLWFLLVGGVKHSLFNSTLMCKLSKMGM